MAAMIAPCSVKASGKYFQWRPCPILKVTICDLKISHSFTLTSIKKSAGNRSRFRPESCRVRPRGLPDFGRVQVRLRKAEQVLESDQTSFLVFVQHLDLQELLDSACPSGNH